MSTTTKVINGKVKQTLLGRLSKVNFRKEKSMFKAVCLLKRHPSLSFKEFREYYESNHRKLGEKWLPTQIRYVRRYLHPVGANPISGEMPEAEYDVLTEMWFESREDFDAAMAALGEPEPAAEILADELKLFDRSKICLCALEEYESDLHKN